MSDSVGFSGNVEKWKTAQRLALGDSQREAARHAGVHEDTVGRWRREQDVEFVEYLHEALDQLTDFDIRAQTLKAVHAALRAELDVLAEGTAQERNQAASVILAYYARTLSLQQKLVEETRKNPALHPVAAAVLGAQHLPAPPPPPGWGERDT
jgi:hypothetical protein